MQLLGSSDLLEIELRKLASFIHVRRTGDRRAAIHMLAVRPPGMASDNAPSWLVDEASLHSKWELQRVQRGNKGGGVKSGDEGGSAGGMTGGDNSTVKGLPAGKAKAKSSGGRGGAAGAAPQG